MMDYGDGPIARLIGRLSNRTTCACFPTLFVRHSRSVHLLARI